MGEPMASFYDFAKAAGLTPKRLAEIEEGTGAPVTIDEIEAIAKALRMRAWQLIPIAEEGGHADTLGPGSRSRTPWSP
jgi:transcriptional regulator with XRE-family HTH domain